MTAIKYTYNVKTKTIHYVKYENSVEETDKGLILNKGLKPIKNENIGKICAELTHIEHKIEKPYILTIVLKNNTDTDLEQIKNKFEKFDYTNGFSMLYE